MAMIFEVIRDMFARSDIIDAYFITSDLVDIPLSDEDYFDDRYHDSMTTASMNSYTVSGGHVFNASGEDCGPVGKAVF